MDEPAFHSLLVDKINDVNTNINRRFDDERAHNSRRFDEISGSLHDVKNQQISHYNELDARVDKLERARDVRLGSVRWLKPAGQVLIISVGGALATLGGVLIGHV